jgi:hypothetical protein
MRHASEQQGRESIAEAAIPSAIGWKPRSTRSWPGTTASTRAMRALMRAQGEPAGRRLENAKRQAEQAWDRIERARSHRGAQRIAPRDRICIVVAAHHHPWWGPSLDVLPDENVFVQPCNRGAVVGVMWPLASIAERDRDACIVLLLAAGAVGERVA